MALHHSPKTVTDGLVFYYDMGNSVKSWIGRPSTNLCNYVPMNWTDGNATVTRGATPPIPPPIPGYEVCKIQSNNGADTQMNILYTSPVSAGYYNHSAYILLTAGTYAKVGQHWYPWTGGTAQYIPANVWTRINEDVYNTAEYGQIANAYGTDGTIYVTCVQYEAGRSVTPFMGGSGATRSSSQAIKDIIGNNTITANSLTYNSDGTFSFDGSYNYMQSTSNCAITGSVTLSAWIKPNRSGQTGPHSTVICTDVGYPAGAKLMNYKNTSRYGLWLGWGGTTSYEAFVGADINDNTNKMLTASWEQATGVVKIYLNGVLQSTFSTGITTPVSLYDGKITVGTDYNNIGSGSNNKYLGKVYMASVYNRALSDNEVLRLFNAHRGRYGV